MTTVDAGINRIASVRAKCRNCPMLPLVNMALVVCALLLSAGCGDEVGGKPLVFQQGGEEGTKFALTFEKVALQSQKPYYRQYRGEKNLAPEGKMYAKILAKVKNLGPRVGGPELDAEIRVDSGNVYPIYRFSTNFVGTVVFRDPEPLYGRNVWWNAMGVENALGQLEPGKEGWILMYAEIPAGTRPVEIFGRLGVGGGLIGGPVFGEATKFRVKIPKSALSENSIAKSEEQSVADTPQEDEIRRAVLWALERYKQGEGKTFGSEWEYYEGCQKFVANAYGKPCPFYSYATPAEGAQNLNAGANIGKSPPKGSWVFYSVKSDPRGHVALSVGEGLVIHAYTVKTQQKATVRKDPFDNVPGATYIGWAWPQRKK